MSENNLNSFRRIAWNNRTTPRNAPRGYGIFFKQGGPLSFSERAELQNAKEANLRHRNLSRNLNRKSISNSQDTQKMLREIAKIYKEVLSKSLSRPLPKLK
jgi:hypothetical protein